MPDIRQPMKYIGKLTEIERQYQAELKGLRRDTRRVLLDILERDGATRTGALEMLREVRSLESAVIVAGQKAARSARQVVQKYTAKEIELLRRVGVARNADAQIIAGQTAFDSAELEAGIFGVPAWVTTLATSLQSQSVQLRATETDDALIRARLLSETSTDGRQSVFSAAGTSADLESQRGLWMYAAGLFALYAGKLQELEPQVEYKKQVIATIDERTTDCCLRAHGQIQPLDKPFLLTGTPRYANKMQSPPFHWYCRSVEALYLEEYEQIGIPTEKLREAALAEIRAREETKKRQIIYPSSATSRRR